MSKNVLGPLLDLAAAVQEAERRARDLSGVETALAEAQRQYASLSDTVAGLEETKAKCDRDCAEKKAQCERDCADRRSVVEQDLTARARRASAEQLSERHAHQVTVGKLQDEVAGLTASRGEHSAAVESLRAEKTRLEQAVADLRARINSLIG